MANTCSEISERILRACLEHEPWQQDDVTMLRVAECHQALFGVLAEGLSDRFDPYLAECYVELFGQFFPDADIARYRRTSQPRAYTGDPARVYVLSRITLGADIAVTSVALDAARRRFPEAELWFAAPRKNFELFSAMPGLRHLEVPYRKGSLGARLEAWHALRAGIAPGSLVIDPDSRLTQLGLLPLVDEANHVFFDSRSYAPESSLSLSELTRRWVLEVFGETGEAFIAPHQQPVAPAAPYIAISLGTGGNPHKSLLEPFETELLRLLASSGRELLIDAGAGGEEGERVARALLESGAVADVWLGSFAGFSSLIARASLYIGYDSAGQHAAYAAKVPQATIFSGAPNERFMQRWSPPGARILPIDLAYEEIYRQIGLMLV